MSRTLSKLFVKINFITYAVNFAVLFVAMMMLLSVTNNLAIYAIPGIFLCGIICLVYPEFFNVVAGAFGIEKVTSPTPTVAFEHIGQIIANAFSKDYSYLKDNGIVVACFCAVLCWIVGIFCIFHQPKLDKVVNSPMDWYKRKWFSTIFYAVIGGIYGVAMCVGSAAVVFAPEKLTGGLLTLAWYFLICGLVIVAGVVILIVERFVSLQIYNALSVEEQIAICEKQAKYMNKRQRRRQIRRLGDNARVDTQQDGNKKRKGKKSKSNGKQVDVTSDVPPITTVVPVDDSTVGSDESPHEKE